MRFQNSATVAADRARQMRGMQQSGGMRYAGGSPGFNMGGGQGLRSRYDAPTSSRAPRNIAPGNMTGIVGGTSNRSMDDDMAAGGFRNQFGGSIRPPTGYGDSNRPARFGGGMHPRRAYQNQLAQGKRDKWNAAMEAKRRSGAEMPHLARALKELSMAGRI